MTRAPHPHHTWDCGTTQLESYINYLSRLPTAPCAARDAQRTIFDLHAGSSNWPRLQRRPASIIFFVAARKFCELIYFLQSAVSIRQKSEYVSHLKGVSLPLCGVPPGVHYPCLEDAARAGLRNRYEKCSLEEVLANSVLNAGRHIIARRSGGTPYSFCGGGRGQHHFLRDAVYSEF